MTSDRRKFLGTAAAAAAFTIVPRHVLGGPNAVPPSDKITLAYIGTGTEGLREMLPLLADAGDPDRRRLRPQQGCRRVPRLVQERPRRTRSAGPSASPTGRPARDGAIPGGRDVAKDIVDTYYGNQRAADKFNGCAAYADFRELLRQRKRPRRGQDHDARPPARRHRIAAMKRGKHVILHKPIANRLKEAKASDRSRPRKTGVATHFMPWDSNGSMEQVMAWIRDGAIGTLREVHNWTNRPVWPQYATLPADTPPVPAGFDWDLWLGPEAERPYHPQLHPHGLPRLVRFRRRLHGGHGPLQPVDRVQRPRARRPHQRRADAQPSVHPHGRRLHHHQERLLLPHCQRRALQISGARIASGRRPHLVRRRHAAAHAGGAGRRPQGTPRRSA